MEQDREPCRIASPLAVRLRTARTELTARWLERISSRVALHPNRIFPTEELLNHMPLLIGGVADFLGDPAQVIGADAIVLSKAMELGALRHAQGFDEYEILKEYEIFGAILFDFMARTVDEVADECAPSELMRCAQRLFRAVALIQQATTTHYLQLMKAKVTEREERLRAFNRALTHEFRNHIGAALGAGELLQIPGIDPAKQVQLAGVVVRNADSMRLVLENLLELTRVDSDSRQQRHVRLPEVAAEIRRQLRDAAQARGVTLRITDDLPDVEVNAAAVELCLLNLASNAIKYSNPAQTDRWVEIGGRLESTKQTPSDFAVVEVRDNGLGVPPALRSQLFDRFFRAHGSDAADIEGTGLGLSIVRETVEAFEGKAWVEFPDEGSVFAFSVPCRRASDRSEGA